MTQLRPYHYATADVSELLEDGASGEAAMFHMSPAEVEHVWLTMADAYEQARIRAGYDPDAMVSVAELLTGVVRGQPILPRGIA